MCVIPCHHLPLTRDDTTVLVAKAALTPLALHADFATGQGMKTNRAKVPLCSLSL